MNTPFCFYLPTVLSLPVAPSMSLSALLSFSLCLFLLHLLPSSPASALFYLPSTSPSFSCVLFSSLLSVLACFCPPPFFLSLEPPFEVRGADAVAMATGRGRRLGCGKRVEKKNLQKSAALEGLTTSLIS